MQVVIDLLFTAHELISMSKDGTVAFWELSSGECTRSLDVSSLCPGANARLHVSADGRRLVIDSDAINSPVCIFDMKTGQLLHKYVVLSPSLLTMLNLYLFVVSLAQCICHFATAFVTVCFMQQLEIRFSAKIWSVALVGQAPNLY